MRAAGGDMSETTADDELKRAQSDKIRAEIKRIEYDLSVAPKLQRAGAWTESVKLVAGLILGVGAAVVAVIQYQTNAATKNEAYAKLETARTEVGRAQSALADAVRKREQEEAKAHQAQQDYARAREDYDRLKVTAGKQEQTLLQVAPNDVRSRLVYVQFRGAIKRELIDSLRADIRKSGFNAPGAERVSADYVSQVKYFAEADKREAERLRMAVEGYFAGIGCPLRVRLTSLATPEAKRSPLEAWISHSCVGKPD